ncbi:MAG: hypothetical protein AB4352_13650 [Hormoscilla sp.]
MGDQISSPIARYGCGRGINYRVISEIKSRRTLADVRDRLLLSGASHLRTGEAFG